MPGGSVVAAVFVLAILVSPFFGADAAAQGLSDSLSHPPPTSGSATYSPPGTWLPGSAGFPVAGQAFVDPVFGTTIRRLTGDFPGQSYSDIYAMNGWWNADGTYFYHRCAGGGVILGASTAVVVRSGAPSSSGLGVIQFDPVDRDSYYYISGASLRRYSVSAGTSSVLKTFPATLQEMGGSVDYLDRTGRYFLVYYGNLLQVWDKQTDTIYSGAISASVGTGWAGISPDGNYVIVGGATWWSYRIDHATQSVSPTGTLFWTLCGDHGDVTSASDGKTYVITFDCYDEPSVWRVDVSLPQTSANIAQQKSQNVRLFPTDWQDAGHFSCAVNGPNRDWCFVSVESGDDAFTNQGTWRPYKQEIVMAQMVPPYTVRRVAHHRSRSVDANYYYMPRVSSSWDGTKVAWASNYGYNAGTVGYADIYVLELPTTNPAPSATGLAPSSLAAGSTAFPLTVNGSNFVSSSTVQWNDASRTTTFVSSTQLQATIPAADVALAGTAAVRVNTPSPGGGTSSALTFIMTPDTTAPTVSITAPSAGASVNGTVTVAAAAGDNAAVVGVQLKLDGVNLGTEDTAAPYSASWNTTTVADGLHTLTAVARDTAGNTTTSASVTVTVVNADTTAPTVVLTAPSGGATVNETVTVTATASDNVGVVGVQFKVDGVNLGAEDTAAPYSRSWNTTGAANGSHTLTAVARDAAGNTTTSAAVSVTVANPDTTAPTVSITAPSGGATVNGTVTVTATASDNVGVVGVQFKVDGVDLGAEDTAAPYSASWNTTGAANGSHTLTAVARDAAGNTTTSAAVSVTVANPDTTAPTVSITAQSGGATVNGTVTVTATASDNVGVVGVQFKVDGVDLGAEDTAAPYSASW